VVGLTKGGLDEDTPVPEALGAELTPVPETGALEVIGTLALELETTVERVWKDDVEFKLLVGEELTTEDDETPVDSGMDEEIPVDSGTDEEGPVDNGTE